MLGVSKSVRYRPRARRRQEIGQPGDSGKGSWQLPARPDARHLGSPEAYQALRMSLKVTASVGRNLWSPVRCEE